MAPMEARASNPTEVYQTKILTNISLTVPLRLVRGRSKGSKIDIDLEKHTENIWSLDKTQKCVFP